MIDPEEKQIVNLDDMEPTENELQTINEQDFSDIDVFDDLDSIDDYGWLDWVQKSCPALTVYNPPHVTLTLWQLLRDWASFSHSVFYTLNYASCNTQ